MNKKQLEKDLKEICQSFVNSALDIKSIVFKKDDRLFELKLKGLKDSCYGTFSHYRNISFSFSDYESLMDAVKHVVVGLSND